MTHPTDHIRLLFGLKLRQLRLEKGLSVSELAGRSGMAISYISEIEKGRKYPKADKISGLANALNVDYDTLVSLKVNKKLAPIADLLRSKFLTEIPLELFGIDPSDLIELLAEAPDKVSAMIRTFMDIALSYNMSVERLYLAMLRSYQEINDNHFEAIEADAAQFLDEFAPANQRVDMGLLTNLLKTRYDVSLVVFNPMQQTDLAQLRSVYKPESRTLHLNSELSEAQKTYILAREAGFHYLGLKNRPYTYAYVEADSFEQILNNYKASYFAGAVLIRRDELVNRLTDLFAHDTWSNEAFLDLISHFGATPERFFYRLSNVLPRDFGIDQLFFYRINNTPGQTTFSLTKEMHLSRQQGPRGMVDEHFCRRWVALTILQELGFRQVHSDFGGSLCQAQRSTYADTGNEFLIISVAHPHRSDKASHAGQNMSVSMCFAVNDTLRAKMRFLNNPDAGIPSRTVNEACERCGIFDCRERIAPPTILQKKRQIDSMKEAVNRL
ncbi:helix-turn-helix domain-containing protein [Fibrella aquatilis]|uniref:Helix-turn-helix domain-containing protein n=1 Tax=Fibrella aquatilis TaxID=2817059 RepID=A0A939G662_9BACT|nr:helix-turn-helix transcriptional regulator [Fibrella aquatilis]MBO0933132.1 helix-turn-helix domain-containing protein [Fibrella aquatilis]